MTKNERLYTELAEKFGAETLEIRIAYQKDYIRGIYFDGIGFSQVKHDLGSSCDNMYCYECRAADSDPCGPPASISPLNQGIMVNFAGTFVTADLIPKLDKEKSIVEYSYDPFNID